MEQEEKRPNISSPQQSTLYLQNFPLWLSEHGDNLAGACSGHPFPISDPLVLCFLLEEAVVDIVVGEALMGWTVIDMSVSSSLQSAMTHFLLSNPFF